MNSISLPEERILSQSEFAALVGVSRSAVCQAMDRFHPDTLTPQGFIKYPRGLREWHENRDPRGGGAAKAAVALAPVVSYDTPEEEALAPPPAPGAVSPDHLQATPGTLAYERIQTLQIKRKALEIEMAEREGRVVAVDKIEAAAFEMGRAMRNMLKGVPALADEMALGDAEKIRALLREKMQAIMAEMAKQFGALAQRAATAEDDLETDDPDE